MAQMLRGTPPNDDDDPDYDRGLYFSTPRPASV